MLHKAIARSLLISLATLTMYSVCPAQESGDDPSSRTAMLAEKKKYCKLCGLKCDGRSYQPEDELYSFENKGRKATFFSARIGFEKGEEDVMPSSKNNPIAVFLIQENRCSPVFTGEGSMVTFIEDAEQQFPYLLEYQHLSAFEGIHAFYRWNGRTYKNATKSVAARMNEKGLDLMRKGKISEACDALSMAAQTEEPSARALNDFGYCTYLQAQQEKRPELYGFAADFLIRSIKKDPRRWSAYLNLGDLFLEENDVMNAVRSYRKLLEVNPDYKHGAKIRERIRELSVLPRKGEDISIFKSGSGIRIVYRRLDEERVERLTYCSDNKLFNRYQLKDGEADGDYVRYNCSSRPRTKGHYSAGARSGTFVYYDENGKKEKETFFRDSSPVISDDEE